MINIFEYILSDDTIEKMVELLERTKKEQIEYGCIVYAGYDKNLILKGISSGNDHSVRMIEIPGYDYCVGDYHVHIDTELPSFLDFDPMSAGFEQMRFVGGALTNKIKCYKLKNLDLDLLNGLHRLEKIFHDISIRCIKKKENENILMEEFRRIHDPSMNKLIDKYFDVFDIK